MSFLTVEGITKRFGGITALDGASLTLGAGEVKGIIGPNGCGKSTLFNVLTGVLRPDSGRATIDGQRIDGVPAARVSRLGVARKFQVPGVMPDMTALEHLELADGSRVTNGNLWRTLRWGGGRGRALALLDDAGLTEHADRLAGEMPHGIKQRLELLMLVARGARLMLLDEPTAGMTATETQDTIALIRRMNADTGAAILVIEHDMAFMRDLACPLIVMMRGRVIREGSFAELQTDPEVRAAYLGERHRVL